MIAIRRLRPDPVTIIAAVTLAGIGLCLQGIAARIVLWAREIPSYHEWEETED